MSVNSVTGYKVKPSGFESSDEQLQKILKEAVRIYGLEELLTGKEINLSELKTALREAGFSFGAGTTQYQKIDLMKQVLEKMFIPQPAAAGTTRIGKCLVEGVANLSYANQEILKFVKEQALLKDRVAELLEKLPSVDFAELASMLKESGYLSAKPSRLTFGQWREYNTQALQTALKVLVFGSLQESVEVYNPGIKVELPLPQPQTPPALPAETKNVSTPPEDQFSARLRDELGFFVREFNCRFITSGDAWKDKTILGILHQLVEDKNGEQIKNTINGQTYNLTKLQGLLGESFAYAPEGKGWEAWVEQSKKVIAQKVFNVPFGRPATPYSIQVKLADTDTFALQIKIPAGVDPAQIKLVLVRNGTLNREKEMARQLAILSELEHDLADDTYSVNFKKEELAKMKDGGLNFKPASLVLRNVKTGEQYFMTTLNLNRTF